MQYLKLIERKTDIKNLQSKIPIKEGMGQLKRNPRKKYECLFTNGKKKKKKSKNGKQLEEKFSC